MLSFFGDDIMLMEEMAGAEVENIQTCISCHTGFEDESLEAAQAILAVTTVLVNDHGGKVPQDKDSLLALGVDETVVWKLMQHVFGSTEVIIGLHTRKIVCAIDIHDWEESGAEKKSDIKMAKISAGHVKASLSTWFPKGDGRRFQDSMEQLGEAISISRIGMWGRITAAVNRHFPSKEKKELLALLNKITQLYSATKSGGRGKRSR